MEKVIYKLISNFIEGVDTYNHNGSTWLIFTESKQWVIELTESKNLWYNYNFFKSVFSYTSMDVVENQSYITKWVEDNIINKVSDIYFRDARDRKQQFEDTIENGVIKTKGFKMRTDWSIEDTIENGVKRTFANVNEKIHKVEDSIQNGVKYTHMGCGDKTGWVDDTIENGVKNTLYWGDKRLLSVDDTIEKGVKETIFAFVGGSTLAEDVLQNGVKEIKGLDKSEVTEKEINNTIQNGVKETQFNSYVNESWVEGVIKEGVKHTFNTEYMPKTMVEDIIQSGVKHTEYGDWLDGDERLDDIVENGVKLTGRIHKDYTKVVEYLIENGVKETKRKNNALLILDNSGRELILESHLVVRDGVKETNYDTDNYTDDVKEVIREGVKETSHRQFLKTYDVKDTIQDGTEHDRWILDGCADPVDVVLDNGVKTSHPRQYVGYIDDIIKEGEKINGTYAGGQRQSEKCKSVVEYGTKNPTD